MSEHKAKAESYLRRAGYDVGKGTNPDVTPSAGRGGPVDLVAADILKIKPGEYNNAGERCPDNASDVDYAHNFKKFERHDDMAGEPNRGKGNEKGQK